MCVQLSAEHRLGVRKYHDEDDRLHLARPSWNPPPPAPASAALSVAFSFSLSVCLSAWQFNCLHSSCCWFLSGFAFTVARLKLPIPIVLWPRKDAPQSSRIRVNFLGFALAALQSFAFFFSFSFFLLLQTGCLHLSQLAASGLLAGNEIWLLNDRFSDEGGGLPRVINAIRKQFNISAPRLSKRYIRYLPATPNGTKGNPFSKLLAHSHVCACVRV